MTTSLQEIREKWYEYLRSIVKNRDYIPEDCIDGAGDWWLSLIKERDAELVKAVKGVKTREKDGGFRHIEVYKDDVLDIIKGTTTPTEGGE